MHGLPPVYILDFKKIWFSHIITKLCKNTFVQGSKILRCKIQATGHCFLFHMVCSWQFILIRILREFSISGWNQRSFFPFAVCYMPGSLVVQRVDNVIQRVNCYSADEMYCNKYIYLLDNVIYSLSKQGQSFYQMNIAISDWKCINENDVFLLILLHYVKSFPSKLSHYFLFTNDQLGVRFWGFSESGEFHKNRCHFLEKKLLNNWGKFVEFIKY